MTAVPVDLEAAVGRLAREMYDRENAGNEFALRVWDSPQHVNQTRYRETARAYLVAAGVPDLLAEVERLTKLTATCVCYDGNPANYEGPQVDCPVHGAVRAFNEAAAEVERVRPIVEAARDFGTLILRGSWSEEQAAEFIAATQARGEVR